MATVSIKVNHKTRAQLAEEGFKLPAVYDASISDQSQFEGPLYLNGSVIYGSRLTIGAFSSIAGARFGNVTVGRYCAFGEQVAVGQHEHPTDWLTSSRISYVPDMHDWRSILACEEPERHNFKATPFKQSNPTTTIGNDVWIGYGAYIRAGISIGNGAIIAARAVVTKDVPPYSIVAGVPAKVIKMRFPDEVIELAERIQWWRYCLLDVGANLSDPKASLLEIEEMVASDKLHPYVGRILSPADLIDINVID